MTHKNFLILIFILFVVVLTACEPGGTANKSVDVTCYTTTGAQVYHNVLEVDSHGFMHDESGNQVNFEGLGCIYVFEEGDQQP